MESSVSLQQSYRRSQGHLSLEIDHLTRRRWRTTMKMFLLATLGVVALGMAAPASAADLAARPYTKAPPPMVAAIYDWSGFYIGINGGGGWSRKCWDLTSNAFVPGGVITTFPAPVSEGCHDASGGTAGGQIGYRWQASSW